MINGLGSIVLSLYGLAFLIKFLNLLVTFVCPITTIKMKLRCKKRLKNKEGLPKICDNFEHYRNEFDFVETEDDDDERQKPCKTSLN